MAALDILGTEIETLLEGTVLIETILEGTSEIEQEGDATADTTT